VERVFASMSEAQRIGQLFIFGLRDNRLGAAEIAGIREHHLGSVSYIQTTHDGLAGVRAVADATQALATEENTAGVRFYVAANQEGGQIQALQGEGFSVMPSAVEQGKLPPATLEADALDWGAELTAAGVNLNFAPVMDVVPPGTEDQNEPIGVLGREFGTDPETVGGHGVAFLRGMAAAGVTTSAKHFPGLGRVEGNTDFTANVVDTATTPDDPYLASFRDAIEAEVPMVMVALAKYTKIDPDRLAVFSPTVMQLLRDDFGFDGVIVSDDIGAAVAIADIPEGTRAIDFLLAGGDLIISKYVEPANAMANVIESRAQTEPAIQARVDDAAMRVLRAKDASGLLPCSG
jgi:beta-N-acetylhexosaminidase